MWDMAVCLHNTEPCSLSTLFCIAMVMQVTACDVSVTRRRNSKIMWHLSYSVIIRKGKRSYSQQDVCKRIEGSNAIIFQG